MTNVQPGREAPTLEAVAARAGVSRATASRVLRGASNVSPQAKEAVEAAAAALAYTPNRAARSLVTGLSDSIAFFVDEDEARFFSDPFFLGVLRGAHQGLAATDLQLVFSVATGAEEHRRFLHYAASGHVDGVLLLSLHGRSDLPRQLEDLRVPTVLSGRPPNRDTASYYVDVDNVGGAAVATEHLLARGRRRVATITGPLDMGASQDRLEGWRRAHHERGLPVPEDLVAEGTFSIASGYEAMARLLEAGPPADAVFAASDLTALGAMRAVEQAGLRVGEDVLVVGFDDIPEASATTPALTTVRQPVAELGRTMTEVLLRRIHGEPAEARTMLPVELVVRTSA